LTAYILVADPAWIEASVMSYYDAVDRIVVSHDRASRGWTGAPVDVAACLARLRRIDAAGKMTFAAGDYARDGFPAMESETRQRSAALVEAASGGADWVLQLDTDELLLCPATLRDALARADAAGRRALDFPARWAYQSAGGGRLLEACDRAWRPVATYPGPVAVKPGVALRCARQCDAEPFRVDFRPTNTDPARPTSARVDWVVPPDRGIVHLSWVRAEADLRHKFATWGHAHDRDWSAELGRWSRARRRPLLTSLLAPVRRRRGLHSRLRVARLPDAARAAVAATAERDLLA